MVPKRNGIPNRTRIVADYLARRTTVRGFPVEFNIEITGVCNHKCTFCPQLHMARTKGHMSIDLLDKILAQISGRTELSLLHLAGDPILHPKLEQVLEAFERHHVPVLFSTNASILDAKRRKILIDHPPEVLIFSLDAVNAETYESIGRIGNFENVISDIRSFLDERPGRRPHTIVQFIYMKENQEEAEEFRRQWKKWGADQVRIKPYFDFPGIDQYQGANNPRNDQSGHCHYLWRQMAVYWDGVVPSCCLDMEGHYILGDLKTQSIEEIWNNSKMTELRKLHAEGRAGEVSPCSTCTMPKLSLFHLAGAAALSAPRLKRLLPKVESVARKIPFKALEYF